MVELTFLLIDRKNNEVYEAVMAGETPRDAAIKAYRAAKRGGFEIYYRPPGEKKYRPVVDGTNPVEKKGENEKMKYEVWECRIPGESETFRIAVSVVRKYSLEREISEGKKLMEMISLVHTTEDRNEARAMACTEM